jgi:serine/threonine protein kinase
MEYLHGKLIVHCDLHSENCFISTGGRAKVGDLGLSYKLKSVEEETQQLEVS